MKYEISDISEFAQEDFESLGTKSKYWFTNSDGDSYLFKSVDAISNDGNVIQRLGEDWSEKIACEIAKSMKIPCADYELAVNLQTRGVITKNFMTDENSNLITGNQLILNYSSSDVSYKAADEEKQNIFDIYRILSRFIKNKPIGFDSLPDVKSASDFFTGYLMLDALVSNQDRHSENWGVISTLKGTLHLAPSFDHAASLGRNESAEKKLNRLNSRDVGQQVPTYVKRARSYFYLRGKRLKTLNAFEYFGVLRPAAALRWIDQLEFLTRTDFQNIIDAVPDERMDDISKAFCIEMLLANQANIVKLKSFIKLNTNPSFRLRQIKEYE